MRVRAAGATTIYITHDQAEAFALADRVGVLERGRLVQLGTPEEIYTSPATTFVARFTGLAGELPVRVRGAAGPSGTVEVEPIGLERRTTASTPARRSGSLSRTTPCSRSGRPPSGSAAPTEIEHHLLGTVADVAFRDRGYEHAVDVAADTRLNGVLASVRVDRGERVGLELDPAGCLVFPR